MSYFEGYRCAACGREVPAGTAAAECPACGGPLLAVYDFGLMLRSARDRLSLLAGTGPGIWRYANLLPAFAHPVSLGEGRTPLIELPHLGRSIGAAELFVKDESANPTGSFKARGMAAAVSRLVDLGIPRAYAPSAGNAALALAAYCAAARVGCHVFIPSEAPPGVAEECRLYGAEVAVVPGILPDAARALDAFVGPDRAGVVSTMREPCRVEGKKTIFFEIEEEMAPDWIVLPTGGGTGAVAFRKAYEELGALGLLRRPMPRLAIVQAEGCAPLVEAWRAGLERAVPWRDPVTIASGLRVPASRADMLVLRAVRDTGGAAVAVGDGEIMDAVHELSRLGGLFVSPEGGAAYAGLKRLVRDGTIDPSSRVVVVNTAGGSRYRFLLESRGR